MKKKIKKWLALAAMVMGVFQAGTVTAFAEDAAAQEAANAQEAVLPETAAEGAGTPFSIPGNGQIVDDKTGDGTKQFLTVQTKNGNTFFLVLDRSGNTENVYMLSMVDEDDLAEFTKDSGQTDQKETVQQVVLPESSPEPVQEEPAAGGTKPEPEGKKMGAVAAIALLAAGIIGGVYYVKVVKPKKAGEGAEDENLEMYDGGTYINEDQEQEEE